VEEGLAHRAARDLRIAGEERRVFVELRAARGVGKDRLGDALVLQYPRGLLDAGIADFGKDDAAAPLARAFNNWGQTPIKFIQVISLSENCAINLIGV
jgi:hypothetical protein